MDASNSLNDLVERIRSWIPRRVEAPASTMSRDFWMPDRSCRLCYECESQFTIFNRRHHCRLCGRVFCGKCSFNTLPASVDGLQGVQSEEGERVRVCNYCYKNREQASIPNGSTPTLTPSSSGRSLASSAIGAGDPVVPTFAPEEIVSGGSGNRRVFPDAAQDASPERKQKMKTFQGGPRVHDNISPRARDQPSSPYALGSNRSDDEYDKEPDEGEQSSYRSNDQEEDSESFRGMADQDIKDKERKSPSSNYSSQSSMGHRSTVSDDGVEGLSRTQSYVDSKSTIGYEESVYGYDERNYMGSFISETVKSSEAPVDYEKVLAAWEPPPSANQGFDMYGDGEEEDLATEMADDEEDDEWAKSPGSASIVDFRREKTSASDEHRRAMRAQVDGHFRSLVAQLLYAEKIDIGESGNPDSWLEVVSSLSWQAACYVKPEREKGGNMDPGSYVKVKCIASGKPSDSAIVKGVVCRKNVAHKRMTSRYKNPRVLLLGGALEYQRVSNQLSSLDTLLQQEKDHLSMTVARIEAHHPNVLLVEKTVSRYAQDNLLNKEITLVLNMKKSVMDRIAKCMGTQVAASPDNLVKCKLGLCELFHVEKYTEELGSAGQQGKNNTKFLMFFEGCLRPQGCTILLRGANGDELKKVKHVMNLTIFAAYHLALETSFLADEGATVLELPSRSPVTVPRPIRPHPPPQPLLTLDPSPQGLRTHLVYRRDGQTMSLESMALPASPLPIRTSSAQGSYTNGVSITPTSSSCVSSAANSPGTSPAQTTFGFQSNSRGGIFPGTFQNIVNGGYPGGGQSCQISGVSASLSRAPSGVMTNGSLGYELKSSEGNAASGVPGSSDSEAAVISASEKMVARVGESDGHTYQGPFEQMSEEYGRHLRLDLEDSLQSEMQGSNEDLPSSEQQIKSILVQWSNRCLKKRIVCKPPRFLRVYFYGHNDRPLGEFLRDQLFETSERCDVCDELPNSHVLCFTHRQGSLTISVKNLLDPNGDGPAAEKDGNSVGEKDGNSGPVDRDGRPVSGDKDWKFGEGEPRKNILPGEKDGKVWMWHRCLKCPPVSGIPPATPRVVMSEAAWSLSFGNFLELSFSSHEAASRVAACGHSLHRHFLRFYGFGSMVACFRYSEIKLKSVYLPPLKLEFNGPEQEEWLMKEVTEVTGRADELYYEVLNKLQEAGQKVASSSSNSSHESRRQLTSLTEMAHKERAEIKDLLERAYPASRRPGQPIADILELNALRRRLLESAMAWSKRFYTFQHLGPVSSMSRKARNTGSVDDAGLALESVNYKVADSQESERDASLSERSSSVPTKPSDVDSSARLTSDPSEQTYSEESFKEYDSIKKSHNTSGDPNNGDDYLKREEVADANGLDFRLVEPGITQKVSTPRHDLVSQDSTVVLDDSCFGRVDPTLRPGVPTFRTMAALEDSISATDSGLTSVGKEVESSPTTVSSTAVPEADLSGRRALSEGSFPILADLSGDFPWTGDAVTAEGQSVSDQSRDKLDGAEQEEEAVRAEEPLKETRSMPVDAVQCGAQEPVSATTDKSAAVDTQTSVPTSPVKAVQKSEESDEVVGTPFNQINKSYSRTSSNISTASDASRWTSLGPLGISGQQEGDPRLLPRVLLTPGHDGVVVAVYDDEATSLIAYAISTEEHYTHVTDTPVEREKGKEKEGKDFLERQGSEQIFHPLQVYGGGGDMDPLSKAGGSYPDQASTKLEAEIENPLTSAKASQMSKKTISFGDDSPLAKVKFSVVCYFAKQFDALRKKCCQGNTEYIRSLSRCKKWGAQGGKSNVFFAKTADDRFVVKQVTRTELNSFLDFAPSYFKYLSGALTTGSTTCLAKILGVYEVKVVKGSKETKMDVIVMENLLFGRKISKLYDLKGSKRSRYNTDKSGTNRVLLDSNLLEDLPTSPIFIGSKAKRILERAVWNDTNFLSLMFVMDYSLLVGVDEERKELVVGIIDFMRQYTWDKHLETWVKASGILGGPKDAPPTVISPTQYKKRFRKAMNTYFLLVPEHWSPAQSIMLPVGDIEERSCINMGRDDELEDDTTTPRT